jgi:tRNA threonylcarbamoyladenosine modification (KEOPS) complex  Pcc1 subunit
MGRVLAGHSSNLRITVETPYGEIILKAIEPELSSLPSRRIRASIQLKNGALDLVLDADDLVALRAGLNTFLRWIIALDKCLRLLDPSMHEETT